MLVTTIDAQWEGMGDVGLVRYETVSILITGRMNVGLIALIRLNEQAVVGELVCSNQHAVNHAMTSRPGTLSKALV